MIACSACDSMKFFVVVFYFVSCAEEKSDWSRVGELIEIGDVPESDAIAFLTSACHHKLSQGEIKFVYDQLTGGRTFLLGTVANSIQSGKNLEGALVSRVCVFAWHVSC